jgi:hypothetical protein
MLPEPNVVIGGGAAALWLVAVAGGAFLVAWLSTDVGGVRRTPYIAVLGIVTAALTGGYLWWSEAGASFWTHQWLWGILAAVLAGGFLWFQVARVTATDRPALPPVRKALWEALVYGFTEGLLLSALPAAIVWQWWDGHGWGHGWQAVIGGILALAGSGLVIVTHHLGYRTFRSKRMLQPVFGCLVLSLSYLLSGNPISAMGGHVLLHLGMLNRRMELPPETHPTAASVGARSVP